MLECQDLGYIIATKTRADHFEVVHNIIVFHSSLTRCSHSSYIDSMGMALGVVITGYNTCHSEQSQI